MKKSTSLNGRRHGFRTGLAVKEREGKTVLTFERRSQVYCWSTDRAPARRVHKP